MIPSSFDYVAPDSLEDALTALTEGGDEAKILAGGQSLLPVLRLRMAAPGVLVDLRKITELHGVRRDGDDIVVGAMTTHAEVVENPLLAEHVGLLTKTAEMVADPQVRHRGTLGGALAHADPAGDLGAVAVALDATFEIAGPGGRRTVPAAEFFVDYFTTALAEDEILTGIRFPSYAGWGAHYEKFHLVAQSWSIVSVAAAVRVDGGIQAGTVDDIATEGVGAALITTSTDKLLDRVASVEEDFDLPRGVESRRRKEYHFSYYETLAVTPNDIDDHIKLAKMGGFRTMVVYYLSFAQTVGHFEWRPEFPNHMEDVKAIVRKISDAGMIPGIHIHYNKAHKTDAYVTPKPDPRLNVRHRYTLAESLDATATTITVEENPRTCTLDEARRFLKIQNELVEYERYSTQPPYQFLACKRGTLSTQADSHAQGTVAGELDVDTWPIFVRFTQNTSIQDEVAERLAKIYHEAGFKFTYFDGAEDTTTPFWFTVSRAQWLVYKRLDPKPLFSEGACKSHFSWHILTRGNAFDTFKPEVIKAATRAYPAPEAPRVARDFTSINFGWIGYYAPSAQTIGTQPDMLEYVTSRAAAWDCPISMNGRLEQFRSNARTPDNLEVIKRWEDARAQAWLSKNQKEALKDVNQEHTLLINESGSLELVTYSQIENIGGADRPARGFVFERAGKVYVTYWHTSADAMLELQLPAQRIRLLQDLGTTMKFRAAGKGLRLPLAGKLYVECSGLSTSDVVKAFQDAKVLA